MSSPLLGSGFALFAMALSARADVLVVDAAGGAPFTQIQDAVDAAKDGDVILVKPGTYAGFQITRKGLHVSSDGPGAKVIGGIRVIDTLVEHEIALTLLESTGAGSDPTPGLLLSVARGSVRVESCTLRGRNGVAGPMFQRSGSPGADVRSSPAVSFARCELFGGEGKDVTDEGHGGAGVRVEGASQVARFDCHARGGEGGSDIHFGNFWYSGFGGAGLSAEGAQAQVFASGSLLQGGKGGNYGEFLCKEPWGSGGDGVELIDGAQGKFRDVVAQGGVKGAGTFCGSNGVPYDVCAGCVERFAPPARALTGPNVLREGLTSSLVWHGEPGDVVVAWSGPTSAFEFADAIVRHAAPDLVGASVTSVVVGVVPASGVLVQPFSAPHLAPGVEHATLHLQGLTFPDGILGVPRALWLPVTPTLPPFGAGVLGAPLTLTVLDSAF